jgi:zinc protease
MASARSAVQRAREKLPVAIKAGARIREHTLENGLTVLLAERHLDPVVAVMLWYKVGARNESEREAGVSHFLEHMMFKGTPRFGKGEVDRVTTVLGGSNNAFTTPDHTAYWFELASDRWETALEIEADRMHSLLLDATEFEAEKAVVLEELAMGDDDPWRSLSQEVQTLLFPRHPYRRPVIGYSDTLKVMSPADMRDYYARFYRPSNAILVLCGDFDSAAALETVRSLFGSIRDDALRTPRDGYHPPQAEPKGERRLSMLWDDSGNRMCMAWPTVVVGTDDDFALDLVSTLLTGGRMSRLHRKLVLERGLATSVSTHNDTRIETGAFWLHAECAQGVEPAKLESAIDAEIELMSRELASSIELSRAKKMLAASEAHESETVSDLAEDLGEFAVDASWQMALETVERIRRVSPKAVRDCAARLLRKDRRVVGWCLPKSAAKVAGSKPSATSTTRAAARKTRKSSKSSGSSPARSARSANLRPASGAASSSSRSASGARTSGRSRRSSNARSGGAR